MMDKARCLNAWLKSPRILEAGIGVQQAPDRVQHTVEIASLSGVGNAIDLRVQCWGLYENYTNSGCSPLHVDVCIIFHVECMTWKALNRHLVALKKRFKSVGVFYKCEALYLSFAKMLLFRNWAK